jgi:cell division protein FtsI (penicillin-binding protein 3)
MRVLSVVGLLAFGVVAARLVSWQTVYAAPYAADGHQQRSRTLTRIAQRGAVMDRNGEVLARSIPQWAIAVDPSTITDGEEPALAAILGPLMGQDPAALVTKLSGSSRFVYLARQVDDQMAAKVREANLEGVVLQPEEKRFFPAGDVGRGLIGVTNADGGGVTGIEKLHDDDLKGQAGSIRKEITDQLGTYAASEEVVDEFRPGDDLVLTIDRTLQFQVERDAMAALDAIPAHRMTVAVMDVASAEVLALANIDRGPSTMPGYLGPAQVSKANLASIDTFEPGSVNKVITMAAAMDAGLIDSSTTIHVPASITVSPDTEWEKVFKEHGAAGDADLSVTEVLARSSNNGTITIAQQLGEERLDAAMRSFGLGSKTALNFPNEPSGAKQLPARDDWTATSLPTFAIGQGVSVTAMQMLAAYATLANGGVYQSPRLVRATIDADGERTPVEVPEGRRVVSAETAAQMTLMMEQVVSSSEGTGSRAAVDGYRVAGKTGTAWKVQPTTGGYQDELGITHYISSFVGYFPADAPRYVILVSIDDPPTNNYYAGDIAAPVFKTVAEATIARFHVPPSGTVAPTLPAGATRSETEALGG